VNWRDVVVDFAFENHRLGAVKRLGVSLFQGPSTREMERLRAEREEAERAQRLEAAFAASEQERRTQLLESARTAMSDGDYETATDRVALVKILDPGNAEAAALDIEILRAQAERQEADGDLSSTILTLGRLIVLAPDDQHAESELRRVRSLSNDRAERSREIQILYTRGLDAFASDDLDKARRLFSQAAAVDSTDADVLSMLDRVETAKGQRMAALIDEVRSFARAGLVSEADDALERVRTMGADMDTLTALRNTVISVRRQNEYVAERERIPDSK
jgi:tetratricopeptide (TPR) repeat protein